MKIENAKVRISSELSSQPVGLVTKRVSVFSERRREEIQLIEVDKLIPYHNQARQGFDEDELIGLAQTIESHGIRQPLTIIATKDHPGIFEVVSGERRLRAAKIAGLDRVPCIIIHDEKKAEEISIIENIHRQDLSFLELGIAYSNLIASGICSSKSEISSRLGVQRSKVVDCINLCDLPDMIKSIIVDKKINNRDFLREVCKCQSEVEMSALIHKNYDFDLMDGEVTVDVKKSVRRRKCFLQGFLDEGNVIVNYSKLQKLTVIQKENLRENLKSLILEL